MIKRISYKYIKWYRSKYIPVYGENKNTIGLDSDIVSDIIKTELQADKASLICRFGATEMDAIMNYRKGHPFSFLRNIFPFWIGDNTKKRMRDLSGFFPIDNKSLSEFADMMMSITPQIDILVSWLNQELYINELKDKKKIPLHFLEPFWSTNPWTELLRGKRVLVVHPFSDTIKSQYAKRELLFKDTRILPEFKSLSVIRSIQSLGGGDNTFNTWFDALHYMEDEIDRTDYDIALIGCGAYGMPLAAHCKKMGKKAIHMGGALQLLFGIIGSRWEEPEYASGIRAIYPQINYLGLVNEHWVRPSKSERPKTAEQVENACYW